MKSYTGLYRHMQTNQALDLAFRGASEGKRDRWDVIPVLKHIDVEKVRLCDILDRNALKLPQHKTQRINEASCGKVRDIIKPHFKYEQIVHHLVVNELKPIILHGFYEYSCGSIPNRGCHFGKKHMERWIQSYSPNQKLYVLKMDIKHFFESIDHDLLKAMLHKVVRDKKFLQVADKVIDSHSKGLPLGYYTSQWFANFFLKRFDHVVKEIFKAPKYMRYMDDMVILSTSKEQLHEIRAKISEYLHEHLHLELKDNWQVFPLANDSKDRSGRCIDFMGFKFYRNCTTLRKSILERCRRRINRASKKDRFTWYDATSIISYMGWLKHANVYKYFTKYILCKIGSLKALKKQVSRHSKRVNLELIERSKQNDELGKSKGIGQAA